MTNTSYETFYPLIALIFIVVVVVIIAYAIKEILANPFRYPYFIKEFDVSRKRNVDIQDYIDRYLSDEGNRKALRDHRSLIKKWKRDQETYLESCHLQKRRKRQYAMTLDDNRAYRFETVRDQTRYHQQNYVKTSYKVSVLDDELAVNWEWITKRIAKLEELGYEATLKEYHSKNQRKLMTPKLRLQIKERDRYTCQICGKYMPDEIGLHIDHIIPVAKGGKTVPSNLQVLCSKCNAYKGAKLVDERLHDIDEG